MVRGTNSQTEKLKLYSKQEKESMVIDALIAIVEKLETKWGCQIEFNVPAHGITFNSKRG